MVCPWKRNLVEIGILKIGIKRKSLSGFWSMKKPGALIALYRSPPLWMSCYSIVRLFNWRAVSPDFPTSSLLPIKRFVGRKKD